jgi:hypothetical protein
MYRLPHSATASRIEAKLALVHSTAQCTRWLTVLGTKDSWPSAK